VVRERGLVLWEVLASLFVVALVGASAAAVLRAQGRDVRMLYEERVAWEEAAGILARLEAGEAAPEGTVELAADGPGTENLPELRAVRSVRRLEGGLREASVEVSWRGEKGVRRSVATRTVLEGRP